MPSQADGWSYDNSAGLALDTAGAKTNDQIDFLLWMKVMGSLASATDQAPLISMLENGMTPGTLAHLAVDTSFNANNIKFVGLVTTGLECIPIKLG